MIRLTTSVLSQQGIQAQLQTKWEQGRFLCVGLDSDYARLPSAVRAGRSRADALILFNRQIVEATCASVVAYKPNVAFYEAQGVEGLQALAATVDFIKRTVPDVAVILDGKRGDIGSTNAGYASALFDIIGADWITVHPYLGREAMTAFLDRADRGVFVLVKTSNPGAGEFQDLPVGADERPLYQVVAQQVSTSWNYNNNCGVVVGAPYPEALRQVRAIVGELPILVPGVGVQGGEMGPTVRAGRGRHGGGLVINSSRDVIFASSGPDYPNAAATVAAKLNAEVGRWMG